MAENTAAGDIGDPFTATDADADTPVYSLASGADAAFGIDSDTGQLRTTAELDYETAMSYTITVQVQDNKDTNGAADTAVDATHDVTVTVTNVDEAGTVSLSLEEPAVGFELTATLTDLDGEPTNVTWQWAYSKVKGEGATWTDIDSADGASYTPVATEADKYLRATANYTDPEGLGKTAAAASVMVVKASNNAPVFRPSTDTRSVNENTSAGQNVGLVLLATDAEGDKLTYTLSGAGMASFGINAGTGQLLTVGPLDYETQASYTVDVTATDPSGATDKVTVTISVTNMEEDGTVTLSSTAPVVGAAITGTLTDLDGSVTGITWQWARSDGAEGDFVPIVGATSDGYTPVAGDEGMYLQATASYTDGYGADTAEGTLANPVAATTTGPTTGSVIGDTYDTNDDGVIDLEEVEEALYDHFFGEGDGAINQEEIEDVLYLHFFPS